MYLAIDFESDMKNAPENAEELAAFLLPRLPRVMQGSTKLAIKQRPYMLSVAYYDGETLQAKIKQGDDIRHFLISMAESDAQIIMANAPYDLACVFVYLVSSGMRMEDVFEVMQKISIRTIDILHHARFAIAMKRLNDIYKQRRLLPQDVLDREIVLSLAGANLKNLARNTLGVDVVSYRDAVAAGDEVFEQYALNDTRYAIRIYESIRRKSKVEIYTYKTREVIPVSIISSAHEGVDFLSSFYNQIDYDFYSNLYPIIPDKKESFECFWILNERYFMSIQKRFM